MMLFFTRQAMPEASEYEYAASAYCHKELTSIVMDELDIPP
jgi:hypothetical protein